MNHKVFFLLPFGLPTSEGGKKTQVAASLVEIKFAKYRHVGGTAPASQ